MTWTKLSAVLAVAALAGWVVAGFFGGLAWVQRADGAETEGTPAGIAELALLIAVVCSVGALAAARNSRG